jgi:hypothetical protein
MLLNKLLLHQHRLNKVLRMLKWQLNQLNKVCKVPPNLRLWHNRVHKLHKAHLQEQNKQLKQLHKLNRLPIRMLIQLRKLKEGPYKVLHWLKQHTMMLWKQLETLQMQKQ